MDNDVGYFYHGIFERNILVVGQIGCGKTTFVQNLAKNKFFCDIREVSGWQEYLLPKTEKTI